MKLQVMIQHIKLKVIILVQYIQVIVKIIIFIQ